MHHKDPAAERFEGALTKALHDPSASQRLSALVAEATLARSAAAMLGQPSPKWDVLSNVAFGHVAGRHPDLVERLLAAGLDPSTRAQSGVTGLHLGALGGYLPALEIFTEAGVDINSRDPEGRTPLHDAAHGFKPSIAVPFLLERGADPNAQDQSGETPAHGGLARPSVSDGLKTEFRANLLVLLVSHGADLDLRDNKGKAPLDILTKRQRGAVLRRMEEVAAQQWKAPDSAEMDHSRAQRALAEVSRLVEIGLV